MSVRERMKALADRVRQLPASPAWDERPTSVTVRSKTYLGGRIGAEGPTDIVDLLLSPTPRVREVNQHDITGSAGRYVAGDVRVGPITPAFTGGGYTQAQLAPQPNAKGVQILYVLSGNISGEYDRVNLESDRSHSWFLVLRRKRSTPS